jgi:hypothetical protein
LPSGLPGTVIGEPLITLPKVTNGKFQNENFSFGTAYGANHATVQINLIPNERIPANDWQTESHQLFIEGSGTAIQKMEVSSYQIIQSDTGFGKLPILTYSVYDRQPKSNGSSSSGSNHSMSNAMKKIPLRKVRIHGSITLSQLNYREIYRGTLDQPFSQRKNGISYVFNLDKTGAYSSESHASWKNYSPSLLSSGPGNKWEQVRYRVDNPNTPELDFENQLSGGGSGGGSLFGSYRTQNLNISDESIESDYYWKQFKDRGYEKSVKEWRKETQLILEVIDSITTLVLPIDIEVEIPDPEKVTELLIGNN